MVELPKKKVGIVSCSGEELAEGTVSRLATLKVLEQLRKADTVTICLPLFLAGGEGDRAFAKFYPTIAVDGCELRCAARGTEMYSSKPAASVVVSDLVAENGLAQPQGRRRLNEAGLQAVDVTAEYLAGLVDELLGKQWDRRQGAVVELPTASTTTAHPDEDGPSVAPCACGSGIPVQRVLVDGKKVALLALPLIFEQFRQAGKAPSEATAGELLDAIRIYNPVPAGMDTAYRAMVLQEYASFCQKARTS
jgi:uncharacterized metal-binding protein